MRITREDGEKASCRGTNGRERLDGSQGRSREEDRHSRRAEGRERETEKEVGKQINQMKWKQLLCRCGRGLDPDEC